MSIRAPRKFDCIPAAVDIRVTGLHLARGDHIVQLAILPLDRYFLPDGDPLSLYIKPRTQMASWAVPNNKGCLPIIEHGFTNEKAREVLKNWWIGLNSGSRLAPICLNSGALFHFLEAEFSVELISTIFDTKQLRNLASIASFIRDFYAFQRPTLEIPLNVPTLSALARKLNVKIKNPGEAMSHVLAISAIYRGLLDPTGALGLVARSQALPEIVVEPEGSRNVTESSELLIDNWP